MLLMKRGCDHRAGTHSTDQQPGTAPHEKVGDGAPDEVQPCRNAEQREQVRLSAAADSLLAQQVCQRATLHHTVGQRARWGDHQREKPGLVLAGRRGLLTGLRFYGCSRWIHEAKLSWDFHRSLWCR